MLVALITESGFLISDPVMAAEILASVATHNCPCMLPWIVALVGMSDDKDPPLLWGPEVDVLPVLRMALVYEHVKSLPGSHGAISQAMVDRYEPKLKYPDINAFDLFVLLENDGHDLEGLLIAIRVLLLVLSDRRSPLCSLVLEYNPLPHLVPMLEEGATNVYNAQMVGCWRLSA